LLPIKEIFERCSGKWIWSIIISLYFSLSLSLFSFYFFLKETPSLLFRHSFSSKVVAFLISASQLRNSSRTIFKPVTARSRRSGGFMSLRYPRAFVRSLARDPCTWRKKRSSCDSMNTNGAFIFHFLIRYNNYRYRKIDDRRNLVFPLEWPKVWTVFVKS